MRFLLAIPAVLIFAMVGLALSFVFGSIFDAVMNTNATPIFVLSGIVLGLSGSSGLKTADFGNFILNTILAPFVSLVFMFVANWMFPSLVAEFVEMIGYDGGIYSLAFWGMALVSVLRAMIAAAIVVIAGVIAGIAR